MWPAFWLIGSDFDELGWPAAGEIDVVEGDGSRPTVARTNLHTVTASWPPQNVPSGWDAPGGVVPLGSRISASRHRYGVYFDDTVVQFYIDRRLARRVLASEAKTAGWSWPTRHRWRSAPGRSWRPSWASAASTCSRPRCRGWPAPGGG